MQFLPTNLLFKELVFNIYFSMMSQRDKQHSKKGNFVSSNAGVSGRDFGYIASIDFLRDIVDKLCIVASD